MSTLSEHQRTGSALQPQQGPDPGDQDGGTDPDGGTSRTERKRAARVALIERTAAGLFAAKGYDGTNFDDIAGELDLRGSSLYHYFPSKEDLFLRCVHHAADQVFGRLRVLAAGPAPRGDPRPVLRALIREQVLIEVRDFPEFVPLFFKTYLPVPELQAVVADLRREHASIFEDLLTARRRGPAAGRNALRVWLGTVFGALAFLPEWYDPAGPMGADELAAQLSDALIGAFPPEPRR